MRRSGQTTRIIDKAIQDFFTNKEVVIIDHFDGEGRPNKLASIRASQYTATRFRNRLVNEHPHIVFKAEKTEEGYTKYKLIE